MRPLGGRKKLSFGQKNIKQTIKETNKKAFQDLKLALLSAPALALPDVSTPFDLFVDASHGSAKEVPKQTLGPWQ